MLPGEFYGFDKEFAEVFRYLRCAGDGLYLVVNVSHLRPISAPFVPRFSYFPVPDNGGEFDQQGPCGLQYDVQGGVCGAYRQPSFVYAEEKLAVFGCGFDGIDKSFERRKPGEEAFAKPCAGDGLLLFRRVGVDDGAELSVSRSVEECIVVFSKGRYALPAP